MSTKIKLRRGDADEWVAADPILADGEAGVEIDTGKVKVGNGYSTWTGLPYFPSDIQHVQLATASITTPKLSPGLVLDGGGPPGSDVDPDDVPATAGPSSAQVHYVTSYGALGDGVTDDTTAIQATINAAGVGGTVHFPPGQYRVTGPIHPLRQQIIRGTHANKYSAAVFPYVLCSIRADPNNWTGDAVVYSDPNSYGVELRNLAIIGPGPDHPDLVHGVYFGPRANSSGERAWNIKDCLISSCSGDGIAGHMWVFDMRDTHIAQCRTALHTFDDDGLLDTRVIGCNLYFNRQGGIVLDGGWTGAIDIVGTRVERSGNSYGYPDTPLVYDAPGIRIRRGQQISLIGVNTDANTGHGLHIGHPTSFVYNIMVVGCHWKRDGGADQAPGEYWKWVDGVQVQTTADDPDGQHVSTAGYAAVRLERAFKVIMQASVCSYGAQDDFNWIVDPIGPTYGLHVTDSGSFEVSSCVIDAPVDANAVLIGDGCYSYKIERVGQPASAGRILTVEGGADVSKVIEFKSDGLIKWNLGLNPEPYSGNWFVARWDALGDYLDTPLSIAYDTGRLTTNQQLVTSNDPDATTLAVGAPAGQTSNIAAFGVDGATLAGVRSDGRVYGAAGVAGDDYATVAQLSGGTTVDHLNLDVATSGDKYVGFLTDGVTKWQLGSNLSDTFYVWRADALGDYLDSPLTIAHDTGRMTTKHVLVAPGSDVICLAVGAPAGQTANIASFGVDGVTLASVTASGTVRGQAATSGDDLIPLGQLQALVAASATWADFQSAIAAL